MRFYCKAYPRARVFLDDHGSVVFADGELETDDPKAIAVLTALAPDIQAEAETAPKPKPAPKAKPKPKPAAQEG